jgi:hypothetical protein
MNRFTRECLECKQDKPIAYVQQYQNGLYGYTCEACVEAGK